MKKLTPKQFDQKPTTALPELIPIKKAAEEVADDNGGSISSRRLYFYCREGRIGSKLGHYWYVTRDELNWFKEHGRHPVGSPQYVPTDKEKAAVANKLATKTGQSLSASHVRALTLRYGLDGSAPASLQAIGDDLDVTRERARQLLKAALHRLGLRE